VTAINDVVDLQIGSGAAELAVPVVAFENPESHVVAASLLAWISPA
jgi:hypothetical protein